MTFPQGGDPSLCWTDIETGGRDPLNERNGFLLELAFRITDADLNTIAERSWLVPYRVESVAAIRVQTPADVQSMHGTSGLWDDILAIGGNVSYGEAFDYQLRGVYGFPFSSSITGWLHENGAGGLPLAGSSVHFDRRWLDRWVPGFTGISSHRNVDVSTVKELLLRWRPDVPASLPAPGKRHRPLPDLDDSITELRHYRTALGLDPAAVAHD